MASHETGTSTQTLTSTTGPIKLSAHNEKPTKTSVVTPGPATAALDRPNTKADYFSNAASKKPGGADEASEKHAAAQQAEKALDDYVSQLERRLRVVEEELRQLRSRDTSHSSATLSTPKPEPDTSEVKDAEQIASDEKKPDTEEDEQSSEDDTYTFDELYDQNQVCKLEHMSYTQFRKTKSATGVCKGSALVYVTAAKGSNTSAFDHEVQLEDVPYRLAINSYGLLDLLANITDMAVTGGRNVHSRPFKLLIHNQTVIKNKLESLNGECEGTDIEQQGVAKVPGQAIDETDATNATPDNFPTGSPGTPEELERVMKVCNRDHLKLLVDFIDNHMADIFQLRKGLDDAKVDDIIFEDLWHLFRPGQLIFQDNGQRRKDRRAYRVLHVSGGCPIRDLDGRDHWDHVDDAVYSVLSADEMKEYKLSHHTGRLARMTPLVLDVVYIDFDGQFMGPRTTRIAVMAYEGKRPIRSLEVYPAHYDLDRDATEAGLLERGKLFATYATVHHRGYDGRTLQDSILRVFDDDPERGDDEVSGQCVIDQAHVLDTNFSFKGGYLTKPTEPDVREVTWSAECNIEECTSCTDMWIDNAIDRRYRDAFLKSDLGVRLLEVRDRENFIEAAATNDDLYMLLPLRLYGYALSERKWHALNVNNFAEKLEDHSFDDLVLPPENKKLLQALVKNHMGFDTSKKQERRKSVYPNSAPPSLDIIRGKGRGLIILLHGVPGVGKTSTAESIAAQLDRPLFPITCGDLGTTAEDVEDALETFFRLAAKWKCVLLLDEADVFLAQRRGGDFKRNGLVSVFLRVLEYYAGILILTTNRVGEFDEAFRSRIHISLYYPPLDRQSTEDIWKLNLRRIEKDPEFNIDVEEEDILAFCRTHWESNQNSRGRLWNGRQIKNGFQTAIALANWDYWDNKGREKRQRPLLTAKQFEYVAKTTAAFDAYLDEVHQSSEVGGASSEWAAKLKLRRDDYEPGEEKRAALLHRNSGSTPSRRQTPRVFPPSTPHTGSSRVVTTTSFEPEAINSNDVHIRKLRVKLKNLETRQMSQKDREDARYDIQSELEALGAMDDIRSLEAVPDADSKAPWS